MTGTRHDEGYTRPRMTTRTLRVGSVPYLVGRPLDTGLGDEPHIDLVHAVPSALVEGLRGGELDAALVSSIELFRRPGYRYLDGPVVAGDGPVSSVRVFLRRPVEQVRRVALDPASRTSVTLVRCLERELGLDAPRYEELEAGRDPRRDSDADAWLRIGDGALAETLAEPQRPALDPCETWNLATGLPFVFACWIVAPGVEIEPFALAFARARDRGLEEAPRLAAEHARHTGLPRSAVEHYLVRECVYDVGTRLAPALARFAERAARLDLADDGFGPEPVAVPRATP